MTSGERRTILICSCEQTMPAYADSVARGCADAQVLSGNWFCGSELERVRGILGRNGPVTIGCTQQAPLFEEVAEEVGFSNELAFANIRETAGWTEASAAAGPKAAALLAMVAEPAAAPGAVTFSSEGVVLIYGRDETAIEAGRLLADKLDVTVLLTGADPIMPPRVWAFPVRRGTIRSATGHLGAFELTIDDFAAPLASSRDALRFGPARNDAVSNCDLVLDLTGGTPLFSAHELRDGYLRADPRDPAAVASVVQRAADLVGEFDKPRYIDFRADLCAHSRSRITGCTRCLDLCPAGAITPAGDHVAIDPYVCAGCGSCAAACPTGAAAYDLPRSESLLLRLRTLLLTYRRAGGTAPVVLFHDRDHGEPVIEALGRYGSGLPAHVLPVAVNAITQLGIEAWTAPFAWGASAVRALGRAKPKHDQSGLAHTIAIASDLTDGLGYGAESCGLIETDDPDALLAALGGIDTAFSSRQPSAFLPLGEKRSVLRNTMTELHLAAPAPAATVPLPAGAPFGGLAVDVEGCTLCLSCVTACPTGALTHGQERPALHFSESACVQCGLCASTCPEDVISLVPQLDFEAWRARERVVKEEEPFHCIRCDKPFGTKSTVERIVAKLEGNHWMFSGANASRLDVVRMCDDCRIETAVTQGLDPYEGPNRRAPRTTEDYLRERAARGSETV